MAKIPPVCCSVVFLSLKISHVYVTQKNNWCSASGRPHMVLQGKDSRVSKEFISRFEPNPTRWLCANPSPLPFTVQFLMLVRGILFFRIWTSSLNHFQALFAKLYVFTQALSKTPPLCFKNLQCPPLPPFLPRGILFFRIWTSSLTHFQALFVWQKTCHPSCMSAFKPGALAHQKKAHYLVFGRAFDVIDWFINYNHIYCFLALTMMFLQHSFLYYLYLYMLLSLPILPFSGRAVPPLEEAFHTCREDDATPTLARSNRGVCRRCHCVKTVVSSWRAGEITVDLTMSKCNLSIKITTTRGMYTNEIDW